MAAGSADDQQRRLSDVSEDELLALIFPFFAAAPHDLVGPGDDAAVARADAAMYAQKRARRAADAPTTNPHAAVAAAAPQIPA